MPPYIIDTTSWRKDTHLRLDQGYSMRPGGVKPTAIVIHTTNSPHQHTAFADEAAYLRNSVEISAHYLNGKQGQIAQILHPDLCAWHAGVAQSAFMNAHSIGIESHVSQGESWATGQHESLTWLVRLLMMSYHISPEQVETHRKIALPLGRKTDPEAWPDAAFYAWRAQLVAPVSPLAPTPRPHRVLGLPVYQRADHTGALWGHLRSDEQVAVDDPTNGHLADGRGFVDLKGLEPL